MTIVIRRRRILYRYRDGYVDFLSFRSLHVVVSDLESMNESSMSTRIHRIFLRTFVYLIMRSDHLLVTMYM